MQKVVFTMSDTKKASSHTVAPKRGARSPKTHAPVKRTPVPASSKEDQSILGKTVLESLGTAKVRPKALAHSIQESAKRISWSRTAPISQGDSDFLRDHAGVDDPTILDDWSAEKEDQRRAEIAVSSAVQLVADTLSREEAAQVLGIDNTNISRRAKKGQLYAVHRDNRPRFPRWQFRDGKPVAGLSQIVACLEELELDPVSVATFMVRPNDELDDHRPVDYLTAGGEPDSVVALLHAWARS